MEETANIKNEIAKLIEGSELISVTTREEYEALVRQEDVAVGLKKQVLAYFDGTEDNPGPVPKAYSLWKDLCGKRSDLTKPLDTFIALSKRVCGGYLAEEQRKEQARLDAIREQAEKIKADNPDSDIDTSMIPTKAEAVSAGSGRTTVEVWEYEVVDEALIPRAYMLVDHSKIRKQVQLTKNLTNIPGIRPIKKVDVRRTGGPRGS